MKKLLLASQSPRRAKILKFAGYSFQAVKPIGVVEKGRPGEGVSDLVRRLAIEKARSVSIRKPSFLVLGADTMVVYRNRVFGKPKNRGEARRMLLQLRGRRHEVLTGVALVQDGGRRVKSHVEKTKVFFKAFSAKEIQAYLNSGEPYDKAGAYDIQGTARKWIGGWEGDFFNVMGLPLGWVKRELPGRRSK
jgi:septum formation protein